MGLNPFKNSSEQAKRGSWANHTPDLTRVDAKFKGVSMTFSDWSDAVPLTNEERQAISDAKRGKREVDLDSGKQRRLVQKVEAAKKKIAQAQADAEKIRKAKQAEKDYKARQAMDKKTGTKRR